MVNWEKIDRLLDKWNDADADGDRAKAAAARSMVEEELAKSIPEGAERTIEYLQYLEDLGCLSYDQWLGIVEEQESESGTPSVLNTSDDPNPH